jgi:adenine-specific DNA-methyltransferase
MSENLRALKELFPSVIKDGSLDVEALKNLIGDISEPNTEYYNFTWAGKSDAFKIIKEKSKATLKPLKSDDESLNFENTGNIFIEGDNLEVLKILQKTYHNAIKMIYIDPPYNKDKDFVYPDRWSEGLESYLEYAKLVDEDGNITSSSAEEQSVKQGRKHSRWLTMMYPRLFLARNLLKDDGVIFISIDDDEVKNLKMICDEIFGEENFVAEFIWKSKLGKVGTTSTVAITHEYILCYSKNINFSSFKMIEKETDGRKENLRQWGQADRREDRPSMYYPIELDGQVVYPVKEDGTDGRWRVGKETALELISQGHLELKNNNGRLNIYRNFPSGISTTPFDTLLLDDIGTTAKGSLALKELGLQQYFDYPKPIELISYFINLCTNENDIVLDFFAGSGTTADSSMQNNRRAISIQLPEITDKKTEAYKAGYKKISEITKERIRRAGRKIKEENPDTTIDTGFKVFRLSESNFKKWDENIQTKEQLKVSLDLFANNVKKRAKPLDMLYEVILSKGLSLNSTIDEVTIGGKSMYKVNSDRVELLACFEDEITKDALEAVVSLRPIYFICLDSSFKNDTSLKTNSVLNFKDADILFETV